MVFMQNSYMAYDACGTVNPVAVRCHNIQGKRVNVCKTRFPALWMTTSKRQQMLQVVVDEEGVETNAVSSSAIFVR